MIKCPNCGGELGRVNRPFDSLLNDDQFDAIRAGDWYCTQCPEDIGTAHKAKSGYAYFWDKDVIKEVD